VSLVRWLRGRLAGAALPLDALLDEGFIALDLETTGLDPRRDAVVSVAAIPFVGGRPAEGFVTLVDPGRPIPPGSTEVHGITDAMVRGAPGIGEVVDRLDVLLGFHALVGHGLGFDLAVLDRERARRGLGPLDNPALDTRSLVARVRPEWGALELEVAAARLDVPVVGRHSADGDARIAGLLLLALLPPLRANGVRTLHDLLKFQRSPSRRPF
jgi:DNA polymerase III epsilon subunit-like protein